MCLGFAERPSPRRPTRPARSVGAVGVEVRGGGGGGALSDSAAFQTYLVGLNITIADSPDLPPGRPRPEGYRQGRAQPDAVSDGGAMAAG